MIFLLAIFFKRLGSPPGLHTAECRTSDDEFEAAERKTRQEGSDEAPTVKETGVSTRRAEGDNERGEAKRGTAEPEQPTARGAAEESTPKGAEGGDGGEGEGETEAIISEGAKEGKDSARTPGSRNRHGANNALNRPHRVAARPRGRTLKEARDKFLTFDAVVM